MKSVDVLFTPADFGQLKCDDLSRTTCVVFDVLRATSSMVTGLANGAAGVIPVAEISEALEWRAKLPTCLLAGERHGFRISAKETGSIDFDMGNSPREFTRERVEGKSIVMSTTNGTRALRACHGAQNVLIGSFLNLFATADRVRELNPERLVVICSGTYEEASFEDTLGAGGIVDLIWDKYTAGHISDAAQIARLIYQGARRDLYKAMEFAWNGRRLLGIAELQPDVAFCLQENAYSIVAMADREGKVTKVG
jgi:2-phosphosulfolactate phosphatase